MSAPPQGLRLGARRLGFTLASDLAGIASSLASFLLVARALGAERYGLIVAISAITATVSPLSSLGAPLLLVQRVRQRSTTLRDAFRSALTATLLGIGAGYVVATLLSVAVVGWHRLTLVILICTSELGFSAISNLILGVCVATDQLRLRSTASLAGSMARLAFAVVISLTGSSSAHTWVALLGLSYILVAVVGWFGVQRKYKLSTSVVSLKAEDLRLGLPYAGLVAALSAQDGFDKPMMAAYGHGSDTGVYGASYRLASLSIVPLQSIVV